MQAWGDCTKRKCLQLHLSTFFFSTKKTIKFSFFTDKGIFQNELKTMYQWPTNVPFRTFMSNSKEIQRGNKIHLEAIADFLFERYAKV